MVKERDQFWDTGIMNKTLTHFNSMKSSWMKHLPTWAYLVLWGVVACCWGSVRGVNGRDCSWGRYPVGAIMRRSPPVKANNTVVFTSDHSSKYKANGSIKITIPCVIIHISIKRSYTCYTFWHISLFPLPNSYRTIEKKVIPNLTNSAEQSYRWKTAGVNPGDVCISASIVCKNTQEPYIKYIWPKLTQK